MTPFMFERERLYNSFNAFGFEKVNAHYLVLITSSQILKRF